MSKRDKPEPLDIVEVVMCLRRIQAEIDQLSGACQDEREQQTVFLKIVAPIVQQMCSDAARSPDAN